MQEINTHNVDLFITRLKSVLNIKTNAELATILGVKPQTISNWKSRKSPQYDIIITKCLDIGIDFNYLIKGETSAVTDNKIGTKLDDQKPKYYNRQEADERLEMNLVIFRQSQEIFKLKDTVSKLEKENKKLIMSIRKEQ